jgi:uncharacterized protein (DUF1499 family)
MQPDSGQTPSSSPATRPPAPSASPQGYWLRKLAVTLVAIIVSIGLYTSSSSDPMFNFSGTRPTNIGVQNLKLTPCPASPNCVCTTDTDAEHGIAPLTYSDSRDAAMAKLKGVIQAMERSQIVVESSDYLHVEYTSKLMGFVDDVEFYFDPAGGAIQVRSASRLGQSDLGVNRKRVEEIRQKFQ